MPGQISKSLSKSHDCFFKILYWILLLICDSYERLAVQLHQYPHKASSWN